MSVQKVAIVLDDGVAQFTTTSSDPQSSRRDTQIPLTEDGSAVRVSSGGGAFVSTQTSRAAATLTASYVTSTSIDLSGFNSASVEYRVVIAQAGQTANVKAQWSNDDTNYWDEPIWFNPTQAGTDAGNSLEVSSAMSDRVVNIALDNARSVGERFYREARYLRFSAKAGGVTTATLAIFVTPLNN